MRSFILKLMFVALILIGGMYYYFSVYAPEQVSLKTRDYFQIFDEIVDTPFITPTQRGSFTDDLSVAPLDGPVSYRGPITAPPQGGSASSSSGTSSASSTPMATPATNDTTPPTQPTGLAPTSIGSTSVGLSWNASLDNFSSVTYQIFRGTVLAGQTSATSYTIGGLTPETAYTFFVVAVDAAGNESSTSGSVAVTTKAAAFGEDVSAPTTPTNFVATTLSSSSIGLSWTAATDNVGVTGYMITRGATEVTVTGTSYTDINLTPDTSYTYSVRAFDAAGNISSAITASAQTGSDTLLTMPDVTIKTQGSAQSFFNDLLGVSAARMTAIRGNDGLFVNQNSDAVSLVSSLGVTNFRFPGGNESNHFLPMDDPTDDATLQRFKDLLSQIGGGDIVYVVNVCGEQVGSTNCIQSFSTDLREQALYAMNELESVPGVRITHVEVGNEIYLNTYRSHIPDVDTYVTIANGMIDAVKNGFAGYSGFPDVEIGIPVPPNYKGITYLDAWTNDLAPRINSGDLPADAVIPHYHMQTQRCYSPGDTNVVGATSCILDHFATHPIYPSDTFVGLFERRFTDFYQSTYPGKDLWMTEWSPKNTPEWPANTMYTGLQAMSMPLQMAQENVDHGDPYTVSLYHQLHSPLINSMIFETRALPTAESHGDYQKSTAYYAFEFLGDFYESSRLYNTEVIGGPAEHELYIKVFERNGSKYVAFANWTEEEYTTNISGQGYYMWSDEFWGSNGSTPFNQNSGTPYEVAHLVKGEATTTIKPYAFGYIKTTQNLAARSESGDMYRQYASVGEVFSEMEASLAHRQVAMLAVVGIGLMIVWAYYRARREHRL